MMGQMGSIPVPYVQKVNYFIIIFCWVLNIYNHRLCKKIKMFIFKN